MSFSGNMRRNNNKMPARGGGPLMTDHLHDLELELELLKRKRQLIQHQQSEMLYHAPSGDNMRYNQPSQSYNDRFNDPQHLNFSHLYNEGQDDRSFGLKRHAPADWSSGPADRFDSPMGGNKRSRQGPFERYPERNNTQTFQRPRPNQPQPLLGMPKPLLNFPTQGRAQSHMAKQNQGPKPFNQGPKPFNQGPKPFNQGPKPFNQGPKPFNQGPKPFNQGPRNLNQGPKPLTQHPNFKHVNQPGPNRPGFKPNKTVPGPNSRPGFNPNKTITPKKPGPIKAFNASPKVKKNAPILMADELPSNKTNGRLELALGMIVKEIKLTYERTPEYGSLFSSIHMARIMKQGIRDRLRSVMTGKIVGVVPDIVAEYRNVYPLDTDKDIVELAATEKRNSEHTSQLAIKLFEEGEPEEYFKKHMSKILDTRWAELLRKLEKVINEENKELTNAAILENIPEIKKTEGGTAASDAPEKIADEKPVDTNATEEAPEKANDEKPTDVATEVSDKTDEKPIETQSKENDYDKLMSLLLQRKLPHLLSKNKDKIIKLFDLDNMFRNTKAAIIINTNKKARGVNDKGRYSNSAEQGNGDPELPRGNLYFVKVLATPSMPKRKIMQEFLNQFKPKTIKRHKKNYNLLFVGLDSKENYDKMLAADQTAVGNSTISISGNVAKTTPEDQIKIDADIDQLLTPQLDDQINDLLSSIRKADEESKSNGDDNIDLTADPNDQKEKLEEVTNSNGNEKPEENASKEAQETDVTEKAENGNAEEVNDDVQVVDSNGDKEVVTIEDDDVAPLKSDEVKAVGKPPGTPAKGRAPATPSSIRTRRSSRLLN